MNMQDEQLFTHHRGNPVITQENWSYPINHVSNAGATMLGDGTTLLLCLVEGERGAGHFCAARSANGLDSWSIDSNPTLISAEFNHSKKVRKIEAPRITYAPELAMYIIVYTVYLDGGPAIALALTEDFKTFEQYGVILPPADTDAAILPYKINGYWVMMHRSVNTPSAHMWLSYSLDLKYWGKHVLIGAECNGDRWNANKIRLLPPPIETPEGWLVIYHETMLEGMDLFYRIGLALFDKKNPEICLKRCSEWMPDPEVPYLKSSSLSKIAYSSGYTIGSDGDEIKLYYGSENSSIALATGSIRGLLNRLDKFNSKTKVYS